MSTIRYYVWNGRPVTGHEYAELISDLLARGHCLHAENCNHNPTPSDREEQR